MAIHKPVNSPVDQPHDQGPDEASTLLSNQVSDEQHYGSILTKLPSVEAYEANQSDEEQLLVPPAEEQSYSSVRIASLLSVLLLGEFVGAADGTLVYTSGPKVASEFNRLQDVSWLATASTLAVCVSQPLIGKLSDIYGRKTTLLVTYLFYAIGCTICGTGASLNQVILGRSISGIGGGGMMTMTSIVIGDLVPRRDIAVWRSYVNVCMTIGRSLGGPVGGWLTDAMGWRFSFLVQVPFIFVAGLLVSFLFKIPTQDLEDEAENSARQTSKLKRIDFLGSFLVGASILCGMLFVKLGGEKFAWGSPIGIALAVSTIVLAILFVLVEGYIASEPIFSLHLLKNPDVVLSYLMIIFQTAAQASLLFHVPLYFEVTKGATAAEAGSYLIPSVVGNAVAGIAAGAIIKRTGRYKALLQSAGLIGAIGYVLLLLFWNGNTSVWESLYIAPAGIGCGVMIATAFVSMSAAIKQSDLAMATSGMYTMLNSGIVFCITGTSAILDSSFSKLLHERLTGPEKEELIDRILSDTEYIASLKGELKEVVVSSFVTSLHWTHLVSLICALLAFLTSNFIKNRQL